jgi:3-deoxy-D-manno-octulosonic-acid transferase
MFVLYNILQFAFLLVFFPFLILFVVCNSKYRGHIPARLGLGLAQKTSFATPCDRTFWIHALSVGEVTSAVPLVHGLRARYPTARIIVSTTTGTGKNVADSLLGSVAHRIIAGPLDLLPVVRKFIKHIQPDLFILVETDFWPNVLTCLQQEGVPAILVNGRVSEKSMLRYQRLAFFFRPMFQSFSFLCMQTNRDKKKMELLGIAPDRLPILGNLKFAPRQQSTSNLSIDHAGLLPENRIVFIAGSTHPGEEQMLLDCYSRLRSTHPDIFLVLAPRDPKRAKELVDLATASGLPASLRTSGTSLPTDIFILDTIGELADFYPLADCAFVGGSLVDKGGHNPIEPAAAGIPVLFGSHMEDFCEIADALIKAGGAIEIKGQQDLSVVLAGLVDDKEQRLRMGQAAAQWAIERNDVIAEHLALIARIL